MARRINRQIHWLTPVSMVGALLIGGLFALGHDLFYASLAGTTVAADSFELAGAEVSRQQLNLAAGTTLAFLFKSSVVSAVSIAYFQAVWHVVKSSKREIDISNMDVLLSALGNAISLLRVTASDFFRLIPVVSIITPATLSVGFASPPDASLQVPNVAFTGLSLLRMMPKNPGRDISPAPCRDRNNPDRPTECDNDLTNYLYNGPSDAVSKVVVATAAQGSIIAVDAPAPNSSWSLEFLAPTLRCDEVTGDTRRRIEESITSFSDRYCEQAPGYVAWTPANNKPESLLPYALIKTADKVTNFIYNGFTTFDREGRKAWEAVDKTQTERNDLVLFMAIVPAALKLGSMPDKRFACEVGENSERGDLVPLRKALFDSAASVLHCDLRNSTYEAHFNVTNGNQQVKLKVKDIEEKPLNVITGVWGSNANSKNPSCTPLNMDSECTFDPSILRHLSYQALMDAFTDVLIGSLTLRRRQTDDSLVFHGNTSVQSTVLTATPELQILSNLTLLSKDLPILQKVEPDKNNWVYKGLWNGPGEQRATPLKEALEELFQNITISLMSSPLLQ
ncbi:hypothetical protein Neosp_013878 [[Neocosmospora] mangrovei]